MAVAALTPISHASAHCFVGNRFFPATLNVDDPCVADELSLPTVSAFPTGDDPSAREVDISGELSKKITETFGISLEGTCDSYEGAGLRRHNGTVSTTLGTSFKFQFLTDPADEFVIDHRPCRILNRCRHPSTWIGAAPATNRWTPSLFTTLTPTLFVGKGFGFMPESLKYLKPLAVTGQVGYAVPTESLDRRGWRTGAQCSVRRLGRDRSSTACPI